MEGQAVSGRCGREARGRFRLCAFAPTDPAVDASSRARTTPRRDVASGAASSGDEPSIPEYRKIKIDNRPPCDEQSLSLYTLAIFCPRAGLERGVHPPQNKRSEAAATSSGTAQRSPVTRTTQPRLWPASAGAARLELRQHIVGCVRGHYRVGTLIARQTGTHGARAVGAAPHSTHDACGHLLFT